MAKDDLWIAVQQLNPQAPRAAFEAMWRDDQARVDRRKRRGCLPLS